jgi:hypothetical protein
MSELYRPSNGSEGDWFMAGHCRRCKKDRNGDCLIIAKAMGFDITEAEYPREWTFKDGDPTCTAFDDVDQPLTNEERAAQMPLLHEPPPQA